MNSEKITPRQARELVALGGGDVNFVNAIAQSYGYKNYKNVKTNYLEQVRQAIKNRHWLFS